MFAIIGRIYVKPGEREEFLAAFDALIRRCREQPGCLDCTVSADPVEPGRVNQLELWESDDHFDAWQRVVGPPRTDVEVSEMDVSRYEISGVRSVFE